VVDSLGALIPNFEKRASDIRRLAFDGREQRGNPASEEQDLSQGG
jgi:hypothetical protein